MEKHGQTCQDSDIIRRRHSQPFP